MFGARIPAVYLIPGTSKLRICNDVNNDENHCHDTGNLGTDWFNLQIGQRKDEKYVYAQSDFSQHSPALLFFEAPLQAVACVARHFDIKKIRLIGCYLTNI